MLQKSAFYLWLAFLPPLFGQEGGAGVSLPMTLSAGAMYTHRLQTSNSGAEPIAAAFRTMFYPALQLSPHWFASSSIQVSSSPYFYFESNSATNRIRARVIQGLVGYTRSGLRNSLTIKAGKMISAFGSFPLRYDDDVNPLIDAPLSYGGNEYGLFPVTLYGLPGAQVEATLGRVDARLQFTNSSPAHAENLLSPDQNPNWTAGGGYTIRQGLRVGGSMYRGAYLTVGRFLRPTDNTRDWQLLALGLDFQWARGRWSTNGEWQRFTYPYPRYILSPTFQFGYLEVKTRLHPRIYAAARAGYNAYSMIQTESMAQPVPPRPTRQAYEFVIAYQINRSQLLKIGYEWWRAANLPGTRNNVFGVQFVTSIQGFSKSFHRNGQTPHAQSRAN